MADLYPNNTTFLCHCDGVNLATVFTDTSKYPESVLSVGGAYTGTTNKKFGTAAAVLNSSSLIISNTKNKLSFGTGDFTIEFWMYMPSILSGRTMYHDGGSANAADYITIRTTASQKIEVLVNGTQVILSTTTYSSGSFYHIALTRNGTTLKLFVSGTQQGSGVTNSSNFIVGSEGISIGCVYPNTAYFPGTIDEIRLTKGIARYTSTFTPSSTAFDDYVIDTHGNNVALLLHCNGTNGSTSFPDTSLNALSVTAGGGTTVATALKKFGTGSALIPSGGYLTATNTNLAHGSSDFTIELWPRLTNSSVLQPLINNYDGVNDIIALQVSATDKLEVALNGTPIITGTTSLVTNVFYHVALSRNSGSLRLFLNGTQEGSTTANTTNFISTNTVIGTDAGQSINYSGYIDEIRITNGVGRYAANFTSPTTELSDPEYIAPTILVTVDETFGISVTTVPHYVVRVINELSVALSDTNKINFLPTITEAITLIESSSTHGALKNIIINYLSILAEVYIINFGSISEGVGLSGSTASVIKRVEDIVESLLLIGQFPNKVSNLSIVSEILSLIDSALFSKIITIQESFGLSGSIVNLQKLLSNVIDAIILVDDLSGTYVHIISLSDEVSVSPIFTNKASFFNALLDLFIIKIPSISGGDSYLAYVNNIETDSISNYDNYNFTSSTTFNGKYLLGNSSGLYEYGGTTDDGTKITAHLKTMAYNFGTSNLKSIPSIYIGGIGSDKLLLKVNVDNKASVYYRVNKQIDNLATHKIDLGKGLIGRYFQFELITDSAYLDIESIEFYPVVLKRKI